MRSVLITIFWKFGGRQSWPWKFSLQPRRILDVDAVIVFSDILIPAGAMGLPFELSDKGPVIESPLRTAAQIHELASFDPELETRFLMDT